MTSPEPRSAAAADLAAVTTAWSDQWWDDAVGLVWMPPDPQPGPAAPPPPSVHLLPQTAWYAAGLLLRDGDGDRDRARRAIEVVLDHQYDAPDQVWHGTFALVHEAPEPTAGARMWDDYDPNWRQFIGCTLLLVLARFPDALPDPLVGRIDAALRRAVEGEPDGRIPDNYSNIALMHAYLQVETGHRVDEPDWVAAGEARARRVVAMYERFGAFDEYNSPTYYGIDLKALGLWRGHSRSPVLTEAGARVEAALWTDAARWYHAGLRNVAGPYTRAYGMDMEAYVAAIAPWIWAAAGRAHAPLPALDGPLAHGMDIMFGAMVALIGAPVPPEALADLTGFSGPRTVTQRISGPGDGDRTATAWLGPAAMVGAERSTVDLSWWDQFYGATAHWRRDDGTLGWLRAVVPGPADADVAPGVLTLRWQHGEAPGTDATAGFLLDRPAAAAAGSGPADLGGATVTSDGPALTIEGDHLVARPGPGTVTTFTVTVPMG